MPQVMKSKIYDCGLLQCCPECPFNVNQVKAHFETGTLNDKRLILQKIGSNFLLKDQKLIIEAKKVFRILEDGLNLVRSGIEPLEPSRSDSIEPKTQLSFSQIQSWWAQVEDVRTFYRKNDLS